MQNAYSTAKTMFDQPSLRPEIDFHGLDYDFPEAKARPVVRTGSDAIKPTVVPDKPALAQGASSAQSASTSPSYKTVPSSAAQGQQQSTTSSGKAMAVSSKPTSQCTAHTFVDAVKSGCLDSVLRHIDAGLDLNVGPTPDWATPLMVAGNRGHEAIVRQLLKAGADVNHARTNGVTALMCAAQNGRTTTVQALLEHGAAIDLADTYGSTALMYASRANNTFCVRLLLQAGANCRLKHRHDGTAMSIAIAHGNNQVIKLLRAHEALTSSPRKDLFQHLFG